MRKQVVNAHQLVLKLDALTTNPKVRRMASINSVPSTSIKIGDCPFKLKSSVHFALTNTTGTNYMSIVSANGKWIHCSDQTLKMASWPKGAKDLHLLFYECCTPKKKIVKDAVNEEHTFSIKRKFKDLGVDPGLTTKRPRTTKASTVGTSKTHKPFMKGKAPCAGYKDLTITAVERICSPQTEWAHYRYYPIDEDWQQQACRTLGLTFVHPFQCASGGPDVILTLPDIQSLKCIAGDGNCLFVI